MKRQLQVTYAKPENADFTSTLRSRVKEYFTVRNISQQGNTQMVVKTLVVLSLYIIPYIIMMTGVIVNEWFVFFLWLIMGLGMSGLGLAVMHDANHGAYSRFRRVNNLLGHLFDFIGGSSANWKIQHNLLHHGYTNIDGYDEDIAVGKMMRLTTNQKRYKIHRFQVFYAWFLYSISTLNWFFYKDYPQLLRYKREGLLKEQGKSFRKVFLKMLGFKLLYVVYIFVIPMMVLNMPWWKTALCIISMHMMAGLFTTIIFQLAHIMPTSKFPLPADDGNIEHSWTVHQLNTTADFAPNSRIISWFIGGLNYQVEHHLFPNICHVHYRKISGIVRNTAKEFGLPYHVNPGYLSALVAHARMLIRLGKYDAIPA